MILYAALFQHPRHRSGVVICLQRHLIAGTGEITCRYVLKLWRRNRLVYFLQGEHIRLFVCDNVYKNFPLGFIIRLNEAVGI